MPPSRATLSAVPKSEMAQSLTPGGTASITAPPDGRHGRYGGAQQPGGEFAEHDAGADRDDAGRAGPPAQSGSAGADAGAIGRARCLQLGPAARAGSGLERVHALASIRFDSRTARA